MRSNPNTALESVAALRDALLCPTPESIEACLPGLVQAAACIGAGDPKSLYALKNELRVVRNLIEHGEKLNRGLARLLGAKMAGYTATGDAEPLAATGTISITG
jgi:hypothetical protein